MRYKKIDIEYWTYPDGDDLNQIGEFAKTVNYDYLLTISKKRTDGYGGGFYDFIIKITEDISLLELAKSYTDDGIKVIIGLSLKKIFDSIKVLFAKNKKFTPSIQELVIDYKDCKIRLYNVYNNGIEENFDEIMKQLYILRLAEKKSFNKIKTIHLPIFNHKDIYNLCEYRTLLSVDEPITEFSKMDYFNYWGISSKKNSYVYDVKKMKLFKQKFYTEKTYNKLFEKTINKRT